VAGVTAWLSSDEDRWIMQGYLQALAELVRRHGIPKIARDMLADRSLGIPEMVACGLEPHDVRELVKAIGDRPAPTPAGAGRGLSWPAEQALISLHHGHRYGIDRRTARGLVYRGLVEFREFVAASGERWMLPDLTAAGTPIAAELAAQQARAAGTRRVPGTDLHIVDGGRA
jgi:hypothetical protein